MVLLEDTANDTLPLIGTPAEASAQASEENLKSHSDPDSKAKTLAHAAGRQSQAEGRGPRATAGASGQLLLTSDKITESSFLDLEVKSGWMGPPC